MHALANIYKLDSDPNIRDKKYKDPIPDREVILELLLNKLYPCAFEIIAESLNITSNNRTVALSYRLRAMVRDGQISRFGLFFGLKSYIPQVFKGFVYFNTDGQALVQSCKMNINACLTSSYKKMVFKGDSVSVEIIGINKNQIKECVIKQIHKRHLKYILGRYESLFDTPILKPLNREYELIALLPTKLPIIKNAIVKAKIISYPSLGIPAIAKIISTVKSVEQGNQLLQVIDLIREKYDLLNDAYETMDQVDFSKTVSKQDLKNRTNLTHLPFVTIDGENAQDLDDAVCAIKDPENDSKDWILYVAIADVSHYVKLNSSIDRQARYRASSVYFPQYTIHMLPKQLSVHLCSLKPATIKLVLVCELKVNHLGKIKEYKFYSAYIKSRAQLNYREVSTWLTTNSFPDKETEIIIQNLYMVHLLFSKQRQNYGALSFERESTHLEFGAEGLVQNITLYNSTVAHKIIEECMIFANQACAKFLIEKLEYAIFRVNLPPTEEKINNLKNFLKLPTINLPLKGKKVFSKDITKILERARKKIHFNTVQLIIMRNLSQAYYSHKNLGHFALALPAYTHFTSPIRRYADLMVHRMIKSQIGVHSGKNFDFDYLKVLCEYISTKSRQIDLATNEVEHIMKCLFMRDYIGQSFSAIVVGFNDNFIFANISKYNVEGMINLEDSAYQKKTQYLFGDKLEVLVESVDLNYYKINLKIKKGINQ